MLGVVLLFVGIVLISNGICTNLSVDKKSAAVMNLFTGGLTLILNIFLISKGEYYQGATGLLFSFTYLYIAINNIFNLDTKLYGWYSLFVAINTVPIGYLMRHQDYRMTIIWWAWGILWYIGWLENGLNKNYGKFTGTLAIAEGIFTAWIPGFLILIDKW